MAHAKAPQVHPELQDLLFKADRPRTIDRYIDYFGTSAGAIDPERPREHGRTDSGEHPE